MTDKIKMGIVAARFNGFIMVSNYWMALDALKTWSESDDRYMAYFSRTLKCNFNNS